MAFAAACAVPFVHGVWFRGRIMPVVAAPRLSAFGGRSSGPRRGI